MRLFAALVSGLVFAHAVPAPAEGPSPTHDVRRCLRGDFGLGGMDPVSYHGGAPTPGRDAYTVDHAGIGYRFANAANREAFIANPERYLPRYAGWCAMAMALGSYTCPDYDNFQIEDGELVLFETTVFTNGRSLWNRDPKGNRERADAHYREGRRP